MPSRDVPHRSTSDNADPPAPRAVGRRTVHAGRTFDLELVRLEQPTGGRVLEREVVRHPGAVCVLPVLRSDGGGADGDRIVWIRNHRVAVDRPLWELPAGGLEAGEPPEACARRELVEETGYRPERVVRLASFLTTPGLTDELMHAFVATGLSNVGQALEEGEYIAVQPLGIAESMNMVLRGDVEDAKSMLTLLLAARRGLITDPGGSP